MRALLDTQAFLWWITADGRLSPRAAALISEGGSEIVLSVVSAWEIAIKARLGRLGLPADAPGFLSGEIARNRFAVLRVELPHALNVHGLDDHHRDPFDRLLVAQARIERLPMISRDPILDAYGIERIW